MFRTKTRTCMIAAAAVLGMASTAEAKPVCREAYQSSPASYERPTDELLNAAAARWKVPVDKIKASFVGFPVAGTVRYRVTLEGAGSQVRVRLSNEEGTAPLRLDAVSIGLAGDAFTVRPGSLQSLRFGGATTVTIPAGAPVISDPVNIQVTPGADLIVSAALATPLTNEPRGGAAFVLASGNQALSEQLEQPRQMTGRPLVSGVCVAGDKSPRVIVAFGDSITDGNRSILGQLHGWPEELARRIVASRVNGKFTVVNAGIGGNRLLVSGWGSSGLARLERDALRIDGISHLILLEGINDIGMAGKGLFGDAPDISADDLIAGYRQVIARAHERGVKVYIATLTPNAGSISHSSPMKDAIRNRINHWIRTSGEPDAVIDFDTIVRDPAEPTRFRKEFDSGDHLHPNESGYKAMGDGINLALFQ